MLAELVDQAATLTEGAGPVTLGGVAFFLWRIKEILRITADTLNKAAQDWIDEAPVRKDHRKTEKLLLQMLVDDADARRDLRREVQLFRVEINGARGRHKEAG